MESRICQSIIYPLTNESSSQTVISALSLDVSGIAVQHTYLYLVRFGETTFGFSFFFFFFAPFPFPSPWAWVRHEPASHG